MNPETTKTILKIAMDVLKTILNATDTLSSSNKQERSNSNAENKSENHKP